MEAKEIKIKFKNGEIWTFTETKCIQTILDFIIKTFNPTPIH